MIIFFNMKSSVDDEDISQTHPVAKLPSELVVESHAAQRPSDQTHPVAKLPSELVVEGLQPSGQTHPVAKLHSELVVEGLRPSHQTTSLVVDDLRPSDHCKHQYIEDWIDLSPDRSQSIWYCRYCECCPTGKTIACQVCKCRYPIASVWFVPSACTFVGDDEKTHKVCETCWWEKFVIETQCHTCQTCKAVKKKQ